MTEPKPRLALRLKRARRRWMFRAIRQLLRIAGFDRARSLGATLGELQFRLMWRSRRRQQADLAALLGRSPDDPQVRACLRRSYRVNNGAVSEIMAMFDRPIDEARLAAHCEVDGLEHLQAAMAGGRGAILLASHSGNGVVLTVNLANAGWPVSVVYREALMMSAGFFHEGLERYGIQGILANTGIKAYGQMLAALRQGRIVFLMLDQGVKKSEDGTLRRFLGKDMPMPAGPAQLARHARAPVLPVATIAASPRWRFEIGTPIEFEAGAVLEDDLARLLAATESMVLEHPELWSWHQRRWRKFPLATSVSGADSPR